MKRAFLTDVAIIGAWTLLLFAAKDLFGATAVLSFALGFLVASVISLWEAGRE
jgi:hypothetical protein